MAKKPKKTRGPSRPFTVPHFRAWARKVILDTGEPWKIEKFQAAFLKDYFAGIPECWLIVPEGNGKTTLVAGLTLYHSEYTVTGNVPVAASSRDQAEILYRQAEGMIIRSDSLRLNFKPMAGYRRIEHFDTRSRIQIFAADDRTGDGVIPTLAICDELHRHRDLKLYRTWLGKMGKRGGQLIAISTAGEPGGEFETARTQIRQQANDIKRTGCFTRAASPGIVMHEWALQPNQDCKDFKLVKKANPFSGVTLGDLKAKSQSPTMTLDHWKRFVCNVATRGGSAAITEAEWEAARVADSIPRGEPVILGLDVGWKWDTTSMVPLWVPDESFRLLGPARVLVPPRDGTSLDVGKVKQAITDIHAINPIVMVVMDTSKAEDLADWIRNELGIDVVDRAQSNKFAVVDYECWMRALRGGQLHHVGDSGLTTHVLNAVAKLLPGGDSRFDRPKRTVNTSQQDRRVIDALVAGAMAHAAAEAMLKNSEAKESSSWRPL